MKTLKQYLILSQESSLTDDDLICFTCKKVLKTTKKFINHCLTVEEKLVDEFEGELTHNDEAETPFIVPVESLENVDLENPAEIVENIEIVVEDDANEKQSENENVTTHTVMDGDANTSMIDHSYIKTEADDAEGTENGEVLFQQDEYDSNTMPEEPDAMDTTSELNSDDGRRYVLVQQEENAQDGMKEDEISLEQLEEFAEGSTGEVSNDGQVVIKQEQQAFTEDDSSQEQSLMEATPFQKQLPKGAGICDICGKEFSTVQQLNKHLASHEDKRVQCPTCPKIFRSELYLNRHINLVHKVDDLGLRYLCMACNKLFKNKGALNAHYRLKHLKLEPFKCKECGETFGRADYLKKHEQQHRQIEEGRKANNSKVPGKFLRFKNTDEPLPCKICGKFYNGIHKLKVHLQTHVVVKRYACDYCDLTYKRWPSLKRHEKTHLESDGMFFRCNVCWKRMPSQEELQVHMTQHGNPRYRCHVCNQQFHRKYLFDNHYLLEHATPEDLEISKKEIIYDTLLELANQNQEYAVPESSEQEQDVE
ncbi:unnamed protein product [Acanthoscelides obtectus]|uniref:C2H2-type domain-containing protein n=1 Tax=Acanthoscelides obtectus TaxID=200917 RepID=A0A9P0JNF5_ACAOB|nr:unnamed protein product [Acanthoscelides obtectus]CAK1661992.1 Zinc finger protein 652-A [Acanthoscelides obtectus]